MKTKITKIEKDKPELLEIHCHTISDEVREIVAFVKSRQGQLTGTASMICWHMPWTRISG